MYFVYFLFSFKTKYYNEYFFLAGTFILTFLMIFLLVYLYGVTRNCIRLFTATQIYTDVRIQEDAFKQDVRKNIIRFIMEHDFPTPADYKTNLIASIRTQFNEADAQRRIDIINELLP